MGPAAAYFFQIIAVWLSWYSDGSNAGPTYKFERLIYNDQPIGSTRGRIKLKNYTQFREPPYN